jgi:hypothetical protein
MLKKHFTAIVISALTLPMISAIALADAPVGITELLRSGYEVKAAYQAPGSPFTVHYMILQKGSSVFQCDTSNSRNYSNTFSCYPVMDITPQQVQ